MMRFALLVLLVTSLSACEPQPLMAVGQLESDRVELVADSNESILAIAVTEGDFLTPGALIVQQDSTRLEAKRQQLVAAISGQQASLLELENGPRTETIAAARASLEEAQIEQVYRQREVARLEGLLERNLTSLESTDQARMQLDRTGARIKQLQAQLAELEAGTRSEKIAQARAQIEQSEALLDEIEIDLARSAVVAPIAGVVDSLPFEIGERPAKGDVVAILLTGEQPFARVYIPEQVRVSVAPGTELQVHVDGLQAPLHGTVRRIAAEAAFTPYFALTERDRSRLSYVAEVELPETAERLPEGLPVHLYFD